ncbi:MAG: beta-mannosidase [Planctomycetota bacterium]|jgi:beta-mannosidase
MMPEISLDLTGKWLFKEYPLSARRMRDLDKGNWLSATVPSSVFTSLIEAGQIKQADIEANPENFTWVSEKPWVFKKTFDAPSEFSDCDRIDLVLAGLDTVASIWLNEKLVAKTNNMFIPYRFDVTKFLKSKDNNLLIKFEPAVEYARKLMARYTTFSESDFINPYRVYIRKAQYQFGWDWCPSLPGCGIFRPVRLEAVKGARLDDIHIRTVDFNHRFADIKITARLDTVAKERFTLTLSLAAGEQFIQQNLDFKPGEDSHATIIRIENPQLWWPVGHGPQHLYKLDLQLFAGEKIIDKAQKTFGIRTIKLNRNPDEHGQNFQFEVNHLPIFAKGANWVPASIFPGSVTKDDYRELLNAAAQANINMLRIWGGGYYEDEEFYKLCDQLGIMLWQDFMFACAYYPDRGFFIDEIKKEAAAIVKQLRNHPCLALWCGNNEINWLHSIGRLGKSKKFHGRKIYHKILPQILTESDPDHDYIPTTPFSDRKEANSPDAGTVHQWDVWSFHKPLDHYICPPHKIPRFVTEFGHQSLPILQTIKKFCPPESLRIGSGSLEKHNYQLHGNSRIYRYIGDLFASARNIEQFVYFSQLTQARAVKTYVEHLRAHNFRNNGVLFWQFNDACPAISWSAIDYTMQSKTLYYYTKRFFAPLLVTAVPEFEIAKAGRLPQLKSISAVIVNDSARTITANLKCKLIDLFGRVLDHVTTPVAVGPYSNSIHFKLPRAIALPENPEKSALHLIFQGDGKKLAENLILYLPDKYIDWPKTQITAQVTSKDNKRWSLSLKSDAVAKDVQIQLTPDMPPLQLSDNFIDLIPPNLTHVTIVGENPQQQLTTSQLIIHSLGSAAVSLKQADN